MQDGKFCWKASDPLLGLGPQAADPHVCIKDPTIVRHAGRWHLFCTMRFASGKVDTEYLSFADWKDADQAPRHVLRLHDQYYCAPQVFYFRPHRQWYLIYQIADKNHRPQIETIKTTLTPKAAYGSTPNAVALTPEAAPPPRSVRQANLHRQKREHPRGQRQATPSGKRIGIFRQFSSGKHLRRKRSNLPLPE